jgi:hypothetical protein
MRTIKKSDSDDAKAARRLLSKSSAVLQEVEDSALVRWHRRSYPTFSPAEVKVGPLLGIGGYCGVHEVLDFEWEEPTTAPAAAKDGSVDAAVAACQGSSGDVESGDRHHGLDRSSDVVSVTAAQHPQEHPFLVVPVKRETLDLLFGGAGGNNHDHEEDDIEHPHYDVHAARRLMKDHVMRHGEARYAIKRLKDDLRGELERARGMLDLAIEAKFLSALW